MSEFQRRIYFERLVYQRLRYAALDHTATSMTIAEVFSYAAYLYEHPERLSSILETEEQAERPRKGSQPAS